MYTLRDIPATMRKQGWAVGAALMDRWLTTGPYAMDRAVKTGEVPPPAPYVDTRLVTMAWAMRFARAAAAEARLVAGWAEPPRREPSRVQVQRQVRRWVRARSVDTGRPFRFGDLHRPTPAIDRDAVVNYQIVDSSIFGTIDDFYAALGSAAVKIAVGGMVQPTKGAWQIAIDQTATYLRDTYDFIGEQSLGSWGPDGLSRLAIAAPEIEIDPAATPSWRTKGTAYFAVGNVDFRRYRTRFGRGGDFVIYSDTRHRILRQPIVLALDGL